mmetsp:Transcript_100588/g.181581  ORF Transcript_100588/g.181581 Transcript_100588/m.181581 type:complete len:258 (+) Transcript_100588:595-1368(+)
MVVFDTKKAREFNPLELSRQKTVRSVPKTFRQKIEVRSAKQVWKFSIGVTSHSGSAWIQTSVIPSVIDATAVTPKKMPREKLPRHHWMELRCIRTASCFQKPGTTRSPLATEAMEALENSALRTKEGTGGSEAKEVMESSTGGSVGGIPSSTSSFPATPEAFSLLSRSPVMFSIGREASSCVSSGRSTGECPSKPAAQLSRSGSGPCLHLLRTVASSAKTGERRALHLTASSSSPGDSSSAVHICSACSGSSACCAS